MQVGFGNYGRLQSQIQRPLPQQRINFGSRDSEESSRIGNLLDRMLNYHQTQGDDNLSGDVENFRDKFYSSSSDEPLDSDAQQGVWE